MAHPDPQTDQIRVLTLETADTLEAIKVWAKTAIESKEGSRAIGP